MSGFVVFKNKNFGCIYLKNFHNSDGVRGAELRYP